MVSIMVWVRFMIRVRFGIVLVKVVLLIWLGL
jgi:hypothetical protein